MAAWWYRIMYRRSSWADRSNFLSSIANRSVVVGGHFSLTCGGLAWHQTSIADPFANQNLHPYVKIDAIFEAQSKKNKINH